MFRNGLPPQKGTIRHPAVILMIMHRLTGFRGGKSKKQKTEDSKKRRKTDP